MQNFVKKSASQYKPARIMRTGLSISIEWYFEGERYRKTFGLNRIKDKASQTYTAKTICKAINDLLSIGINPLDQDQKQPLTQNGNISISTLSDALDLAYNKAITRTSKERTKTSYKSNYKLFLDYLKAQKLNKLKVNEFTPLIASSYQDFLIASGYANKTVNTKVDFASKLFGILNDLEIIDKNPFRKISAMSKKVALVITYSFDELKAIKKYLYEDKAQPELWVIAMVIYYSYTRPASIVKFQRKHLDFENRTLTIPGEFHKNGKPIIKELVPPLCRYLENYKDLDSEMFLFGRRLKPDVKNVAPTRISEAWKEKVKSEPLIIDKDIYIMKDTGANHFLMANKGRENLKWLQIQMAHADLQTTSIYTNKLTEVKLDDTSNIVDI